MGVIIMEREGLYPELPLMQKRRKAEEIFSECREWMSVRYCGGNMEFGRVFAVNHYAFFS